MTANPEADGLSPWVPWRVALAALATIGDLSCVSVYFVSDGGALISVHEASTVFMARLLALTGLSIADVDEPRHKAEPIAFGRSRHLFGGLSVSWYRADAKAALAELATRVRRAAPVGAD